MTATTPGPQRIPGPWRHHGACLTHDPDWWYAAPGAPETRRALRICRSCPVLAACLTHAMDTDEPHGVWGGTRPRTRTIARHRRDTNRQVTA